MTERNSEGPMFSGGKTSRFISWSGIFILSHPSMIARCGANQVVISGSEAISVCTIFVFSPLNIGFQTLAEKRTNVFFS